MNKYKLYLITDRFNYDMGTFLSIVETACENGVTMVQLREKKISTRTFYTIALKVKNITDRYKIPLIINDRIDICLAVDASGVHIGDDELPIGLTRKLIGESKILGVSSKSLERAKQAESEGADYLGVGAIFPTKTKESDLTPIHTLKNITQNIDTPVVAIGGINENNLDHLRDTGIQGVSLVSEIMKAENVSLKTIHLNEKLNLILKENTNDY